jgi:hypothetical protein
VAKKKLFIATEAHRNTRKKTIAAARCCHPLVKGALSLSVLFVCFRGKEKAVYRHGSTQKDTEENHRGSTLLPPLSQRRFVFVRVFRVFSWQIGS